LKKGFATTNLLLLVLTLPVMADGGTKIGDRSDGSQAVPVHLIKLFDEQGNPVSPGDQLVQPFSARQTCGKCHSYEVIRRGWHFNAPDANVVPGRPGQPWIYVEPATATQVPISYRHWPGTFQPEQLGISPWQFTILFARHTPGGGAGELEPQEPAEVMRRFVSGKLEVNCLSCHNAASGQDQAEYAAQVARQNLRWAAAASSEFASVTGSAASQPDTYDPLVSNAIATRYNSARFDYRNRVQLDIVRRVPNERCLFCHSNMDIDKDRPEEWMSEPDVHLAAGLNCVDCHRNGLPHDIIRGYEGEASVTGNLLAASSTCKGCHLGTGTHPPDEGRLGAPSPSHRGIPPVHFEKLSCTACHSGIWPGRNTYRTKTARAHKLGLHTLGKSDNALPHIIYPVFARQVDGKIAPHKLIWPAFWATMEHEQLRPINLKSLKIVQMELGRIQVPADGNWPRLTVKEIADVLKLLSSSESIDGRPVYVCGGTVYSLGQSGQLVEQANHPAARPYLWPIAHNVRPAAQALGVNGCRDCHRTDAPFVFGKVEVDSPLAGETNMVEMFRFQNVDPTYMKVFGLSFVFRPWLKVVIIFSCVCLLAVVLCYGLGVVGYITRLLGNAKE